MQNWRYALASVVGTSHLASLTPCQDRSSCHLIRDGHGQSVLAALVADGAGSARCADRGAAITCRRFLSAARDVFRAGASVSDLDEAFVHDVLEAIQKEASDRAASNDATLRDYACTSLGALVGPESALFWQIGDGAIVVDRPGSHQYDWVFWPQAGEYANHTYFVTDKDAEARVAVLASLATIEEVALFSDGIERLALHFASRRAHGPFFRPIFQAVRTERPGRARKLSAALATYLGSEPVSTRTDDDKTLIVASRRTRDAAPVAAGADAGI
jgi:hypothetical protein